MRDFRGKEFCIRKRSQNQKSAPSTVVAPTSPNLKDLEAGAEFEKSLGELNDLISNVENSCNSANLKRYIRNEQDQYKHTMHRIQQNDTILSQMRKQKLPHRYYTQSRSGVNSALISSHVSPRSTQVRAESSIAPRTAKLSHISSQYQSIHVNKYVHPCFVIPQYLTAEQVTEKLSDPSLVPTPKTEEHMAHFDKLLLETLFNPDRLVRYKNEYSKLTDDEDTNGLTMLFDDLRKFKTLLFKSIKSCLQGQINCETQIKDQITYFTQKFKQQKQTESELKQQNAALIRLVEAEKQHNQQVFVSEYLEGLCQKVYLNYVISNQQRQQAAFEEAQALKPEVDILEEAQRLRLDHSTLLLKLQELKTMSLNATVAERTAAKKTKELEAQNQKLRVAHSVLLDRHTKLSAKQVVTEGQLAELRKDLATELKEKVSLDQHDRLQVRLQEMQAALSFSEQTISSLRQTNFHDVKQYRQTVQDLQMLNESLIKSMDALQKNVKRKIDHMEAKVKTIMHAIKWVLLRANRFTGHRYVSQRVAEQKENNEIVVCPNLTCLSELTPRDGFDIEKQLKQIQFKLEIPKDDMREFHESSLDSIDGVKKADIIRSRRNMAKQGTPMFESDYNYKKADLFDFNQEVEAEERIFHFENQLKY